MADQYGYMRGEYSTSNRTYFPDSSSDGYGYGTKPFAQQTDYKYSSRSPANTWGTGSGQDWRQPPYSSGSHYGGSGRYSSTEHSIASSAATHDYGMNDSWNRPLYQTTRNDCSSKMQGMNNGWGSSRPNTGNGGVAWSGTSDYCYPSSLSTPTNNIGAALETLKEAAALPASSSAVVGGFQPPVSSEHRYDKWKLTSRPPDSGRYY